MTYIPGSVAPAAASYITQVSEPSLSGEQALASLSTGYLKGTTGTGVVSSQAVPIPIADGGTNATSASAARTSLGLAISTNVQAWDADLDTIAALSPSNDDIIQRKAGAWANRTIAQLKTDLSLSGTNSGDQTIALTGDVTGSGTGSFAATIANSAVTLAKMANMATASLLGRNTAGTGAPEVLSAATAKTLLSLNNVENTALSTWAGTTNITTLGTIVTGVWSGTAITAAKGGTGLTSLTSNVVYKGNGTSALATSQIFDTGSAVLINATTAYGRLGQRFETNTSANYGGMAINTWSATAAECPLLEINRSKSASLGTYTAVVDQDLLGGVLFRGSNGSGFSGSAGFLAQVDGTPSTSIPTSFTLRVQDNAGNVKNTLVLSALGSVIATDGSSTSTSRTDQFLYIPTTAGAPSGVPTAFTGRVAMVYDTSNNQLYVYNGSWRKVTLT